MTHNELLANIKGAVGLLGTDKSMIMALLHQSNALRAVVELCKSNDDTYKMISSLEILEAIEKELK